MNFRITARQGTGTLQCKPALQTGLRGVDLQKNREPAAHAQVDVDQYCKTTARKVVSGAELKANGSEITTDLRTSPVAQIY